MSIARALGVTCVFVASLWEHDARAEEPDRVRLARGFEPNPRVVSGIRSVANVSQASLGFTNCDYSRTSAEPAYSFELTDRHDRMTLLLDDGTDAHRPLDVVVVLPVG